LASPAQASAPLWLKVLVIVMGLLIVAGFVVIAAEIARRMSTPNAGRPPASATFSERIALPSGARVVSMSGKDRGAIFLAGKNPNHAVYWYDRETGRFVTSAAYQTKSGDGAAAAHGENQR